MNSEDGSKEMVLHTPMLNELESGPWPSFVKDLKEYSKKKPQVMQLLNQLEESYENKWNYWLGKSLTCRDMGVG